MSLVVGRPRTAGGRYPVDMRFVPTSLAAAAVLLVLAGCSAEPPEPSESPTTSDASTALDGSTSAPISTATFDEAGVISACSTAIQERDFAEGGASFEEGYPARLAVASIRDGEWLVVFRPDVATGQTDYYCVSSGDKVVPMNRDEYTESVS